MNNIPHSLAWMSDGPYPLNIALNMAITTDNKDAFSLRTVIETMILNP
jgi:hypothetical protein